MDLIYLDHIAASPLLAEAREAMLPFFGAHFGNPQSKHRLGDEPRRAIAIARESVASLISCDPREIIFTASASEANNLALKSVLAPQNKGRHIITSAIEHYSVAHPIKYLEKEGFEVTWLPVNSEGQVTAAQVAEALRPDTVLVSILHANNEIASLQPLAEISALVANTKALMHTDAVGSIGIVPFDCAQLGLDLAVFSAQQFYGPKGVGALYVRRGTRLRSLIEGGIQEGGRRAGTENVAGIVGMGVAAKAAEDLLSSEYERLSSLSALLIEGLLNKVPLLHLTGSAKARLPHVVSFAVEYLDGQALIKALEKQGVIAASGSSCSTDALKISPVLTALGLPGNVAQGGIVFSLGRSTTRSEIESLLSIFPACVEQMRAVSPLYAKRFPKSH